MSIDTGLTYRAAGLHKALDLGEWWLLETGLPLPLGVNVARRDLGARLRDVSETLAEAIRVGLGNRKEAMEYAIRFGRGIDARTADEQAVALAQPDVVGRLGRGRVVPRDARPGGLLGGGHGRDHSFEKSSERP